MKKYPIRHRNIAHMITGLGVGGAEIYLRMMLLKFDRSKYNHFVYFFNCSRNHQVKFLNDVGISVKCVNLPSPFDFRRFLAIYNFLKDDSINIVHTHLPVISIYARIICALLRIPLIYTEHNEWSRYNIITRILNKLTYRLNKKVIVVSPQVYNSITIFSKDNICIINNSIDPSSLKFNSKNFNRSDFIRKLNISEDAFVIGNVANFTPKKNHQLLVSAFADFVNRYKINNAYLLLIGQFFGREDELISIANYFNVQNKLILLDNIEDAYKYIKHFDVFSLSSLYEGLPISLLEAMSFGRPIISTRAGGIPNVITDGVDGILCESNIVNYSDRLYSLYSEKDFRNSLGKSAYSKVISKFSLDSASEKLTEIYNQTF